MGEQTFEWLSSEAALAEFGSADKLLVWLEEQAKVHGYQYCLAHAYDGVIWGRFDTDNHLHLSTGLFPGISATLNPDTLQEARLFGEAGELLLWKSGDGFAARQIADGVTVPQPEDGYEEKNWLWGTAEQDKDGFTLMREGAEGLLHALPLKLKKGQRAALRLRHYFVYDELGQASIILSRLVNLEVI